MIDEYHFHVGHFDQAESLVKKYHYSKRMAGNVQFCCTWHKSGGLFNDYGDAVAACIFSIPPTRWSVPLLELSRLVRSPECNRPLTQLISAACKMLKRKKQTLVVSFADMTEDHHGGIYQASSWFYSNFREPSQDGLLINGTFVPGRSCNSRWGTRSPSKLGEILKGQEVAPHFDKGKHLYWKPLGVVGKRDAELIGLQKLQYPRPSSGQINQYGDNHERESAV